MLKTLRPLKSRLGLLSIQRVNYKTEDNFTEMVESLEQVDAVNESPMENKTDKSNLHPAHINMVHDYVPYSEPKTWFHETVRYKQRMYGRYGSASGVNPGLMWPTKQDLKETREYEELAYPDTLQEMMLKAENNRFEQEKLKLAREKEIINNMDKLVGWLEDLQKRKGQKLAAALAVQQRKEKLIEEVRRHFGYKIDTRDPQFKEYIEQKEKEQKKAAKEARKKEKQARLQAQFS